MSDKTMHEEYGGPNDELGKHKVCKKCGHCKDCGDCDKHGCGDKLRTTKRTMHEDTIIAEQSLNDSKIKRFTDFIIESLEKHQQQNRVLRVRKKFGVDQANNTMKRHSQEVLNFVIKNYLREK